MSVFFSFNYLLLPPLYLHILDISFFYIFSRIDPMFQAVVAEILQRIVKFVHILGSYYKGPISPLDTHSEPPSERLFFSISSSFFIDLHVGGSVFIFSHINVCPESEYFGSLGLPRIQNQTCFLDDCKSYCNPRLALIHTACEPSILLLVI